jgi:pilus assembly protein CpaD
MRAQNIFELPQRLALTRRPSAATLSHRERGVAGRPTPSPPRGRWRYGAVAQQRLAVALSLALAGCGAQYASSDPAFPGDFATRHPIALVSAPSAVDVWPTGGALDPRTVANLRAFAGRYREFGSGEIVILTPATGRPDSKAVAAIKRALVNAGASGRIGVSSYAPGPPERAAPIRVAFIGLKATVATPCGNWPDDLASGSSLDGWKNEPYANFGCASQAVLAAEVDDPRDFVESRAPAPSDVVMRMRAIEDVRKGRDPGTTWSTDLTPIGGSGSP